MDQIDAILLREIQHDAARSNRELGEIVGLSAGAVHKRLKHLRRDGYVRATTALVDRNKVGLDLMCFLLIGFRDNMAPDNMARLRTAVEGIPEILECYTTTGTEDAIVKVTVRDHNALKALLKRLAEAQDVISRIQTALALDELKNVTELPVVAPEKPRT